MRPCPQHPMGCTCSGRMVFPPIIRQQPGVVTADLATRATVATATDGRATVAATAALLRGSSPAVEVQQAPDPITSPTGLRGYVHRWFNRGSTP